MSDLVPGNALDPTVMLATSVHAQPGVYALLLGSGVSTGAGILTGWGIIKDLVRRAAAVQAPDDAEAPDRAFDDPEAWWAEHGDGHPLGYSNLLEALASTPAARRNLIARYFEPTEDEVDEGQKTPSPAHRAIAELVRRGSVRAILTTNFDRLAERALEDAGVAPQVIRTPADIPGMTPLAHAPATVIKLHGDYADLLMRNTVDELDSYPAEWDALLDRVLEEYGLIVSGWSADWDKALVAAHRRVRSRRYPLFWDSRSSKGEAAKDILSLHRGVVVPSADADTMFRGLVDRVDALKKIGQTGNSHRRYPPSHLIREQMSDTFPELLHGEEDYGRAQNEFEYKLALYQFLYPNGGPTPGEFLIGFDGWGMGDFTLLSEFQDVAKASPDDWPWWSNLGKRDEFDETMGKFYEQLRQIRQR